MMVVVREEFSDPDQAWGFYKRRKDTLPADFGTEGSEPRTEGRSTYIEEKMDAFMKTFLQHEDWDTFHKHRAVRGLVGCFQQTLQHIEQAYALGPPVNVSGNPQQREVCLQTACDWIDMGQYLLLCIVYRPMNDYGTESYQHWACAGLGTGFCQDRRQGPARAGGL